jgi:DNA-binding XRE family transcriptional regulator
MSDELRNRLKNNVRRLREDRLLTKAELARKAGVSTLTIDRVEAGHSCRMDTKRKIILALGMTVADKDQVFARDDEDAADASDSLSGVGSRGLSSDDSSAKGD